jgi:hypothetical protein
MAHRRFAAPGPVPPPGPVPLIKTAMVDMSTEADGRRRSFGRLACPAGPDPAAAPSPVDMSTDRARDNVSNTAKPWVGRDDRGQHD